MTRFTLTLLTSALLLSTERLEGQSRAAANDTTAPQARRFTAHAIVSSVYDSNIEHDENNIKSYGVITGVGARYQDREIRPAFQLSYEVARHAYTQVDDWDRISHDLSAYSARRLSRKFILEAIGEVALKGSSEDRDIGNQYIFVPRLSYRLTPSQRLRLYGAYRLRRYDTDQDRDAVNRYAGLEFRQIARKAGQWDMGYRFETNSAKGERRSYTRRSYLARWTAPFLKRDAVALELVYRSQRYDKRSITVDETTMPRHDHRLQPSFQWIHPLTRDASLILAYDFENHTSNDPSHEYRDHLLSLTSRYDF